MTSETKTQRIMKVLERGCAANWHAGIAAILGDEVAVVSSNLESIRFVQDSGELFVTFKGSGTYRYDGVTLGLFEEFLAAPSVGKFFHANVKGKFQSTKL